MTVKNLGNNRNYLLTGCTGFLGSHIMAGLLIKGNEVSIAGRPKNGISLQVRIRKLLTWFGIEHLVKQLEFYETDFLKNRLGLTVTEYENLCSKNLTIIHCASDTSFTEKNREKVMRSNVESLAEILNFAQYNKAACFHFISTAFAAGTDHIDCPEAPVKSTHFTNVYEESKASAEKIVAQRCSDEGIPYTIIRPSIVYGNSNTGRSLKFNALYYPVRFIRLIRDIYLADLKDNEGRKAAEGGIHLKADGILHLPIRIFIPNKGEINLIPVDYFTETVFKIFEKPSDKTFYHITSNNPENMMRLISYTERFLNISGIEVIVGRSVADEMRNPPEELFDHFIKAYRPYISDRRNFLRENTDRVTCGALPPDFNYEIFQKCMAFAVSTDWGGKLFL